MGAGTDVPQGCGGLAVQPDGLGFNDRRHICDDHHMVFWLRCHGAVERFERARVAIAPLLPA
ncbi:hypothetical protein ABH920_001944 [Catenulispora sp. EB89]